MLMMYATLRCFRVALRRYLRHIAAAAFDAMMPLSAAYGWLCLLLITRLRHAASDDAAARCCC